MARFEITAPNGSRYEITAPDDASEADVMGYAQKQFAMTEQPEREKRGMLESLGRGALQGATFGFSDEIYGAGAGALAKLRGGDYSDAYNRNVEEVRRANSQAKADNPGSYLVGEIGGGVALPVGALGTGARAATTIGGRMAQGAKAGAAYGAAYGAGTGEGIEGKLTGAAGGAIGGAAFGAAAAPAVDAAGAVLRGVAAPVKSYLNPRSAAAQKLAERLQQDNLTVSQATQKLANSGDDLSMLADVGGKNTQSLMRSALNMPNAEKDRFLGRLDARQKMQPKVIEYALGDSLGTSGRNFYQAVDDVVAQRDKAASTLFDDAFKAPWNVKADDPLVEVLQRPYMARVLEKTAENVQGMSGKSADQIPPWQLIHRAKMQIDREIGNLKRGLPDNKAGWTLSDLVQMKRELVGAVKASNPAYGRAIDRYAGDMALKNAAEDGFEGALRLPPEEIRRALAGLSPSERDMWRLGAARAVGDKTSKGSAFHDRVKRDWESPDMTKRMAAIFDSPGSYRRFRAKIEALGRQAETRRKATGNSTTAEQLTEGAEAGQLAEGTAALANAMKGNFGSALNYMSRQANRFTGMNPQTAAETLRMLQTRAGDRGMRELDALLRQAGEAAAMEPAKRAEITRALIAATLAGSTTELTADPKRERERLGYR